MNKIYDNGALMLGNIEMVIKEVKREIETELDMCFTDTEELLKDLEEISVEVGKDTVVCINYENGMGYTIDYWTDKDIIKESGVE